MCFLLSLLTISFFLLRTKSQFQTRFKKNTTKDDNFCAPWAPSLIMCTQTRTRAIFSKTHGEPRGRRNKKREHTRIVERLAPTKKHSYKRRKKQHQKNMLREGTQSRLNTGSVTQHPIKRRFATIRLTPKTTPPPRWQGWQGWRGGRGGRVAGWQGGRVAGWQGQGI